MFMERAEDVDNEPVGQQDRRQNRAAPADGRLKRPRLLVRERHILRVPVHSLEEFLRRAP